MALGKWAQPNLAGPALMDKINELRANGEVLRLTHEMADVTDRRITAVEKRTPGAKELTKRETELAKKLAVLDPTGTWKAFYQVFLKKLGR